MALLLVADDVQMSRELTARHLRERGHQVLAVGDGEEAVERASRDRPEVAILDVNMPRLSGIEACQRIKAATGGLGRVILVSARADLTSRLQALAVADDFLPKPLDVEELGARIEVQLRTRRLLDEQRHARDAVTPPVEADATGLRGEGFLLERLATEWKRSVRYNEPLSLVLVAAPPGDTARAAVAAGLQRVLRQLDVLSRSLGDRLAALLPNTHVAGALVAAQRVRRELARSPSPSGSGPLGAAMGIACYPGRDIAAPDDLVRFADLALARALEEGPAEICIYQHQGYLFRPES